MAHDGIVRRPDPPQQLVEEEPGAIWDVLADEKYAKRLNQHTERLRAAARMLGGDLRRLRAAADGDVGELSRASPRSWPSSSTATIWPG